MGTGGMKRKLSVAIAFLGNPKFILLATHYMEEAEILADNIAIMKLGSLQSEGNLLALKRRFGLGYKLRALLNHNYNTTTTNNKETNDKEEVESNVMLHNNIHHNNNYHINN